MVTDGQTDGQTKYCTLAAHARRGLTTESGDSVSYCTTVYDKRDSFNFPIANFPFMKSNIPSGPVYISQLVRF